MHLSFLGLPVSLTFCLGFGVATFSFTAVVVFFVLFAAGVCGAAVLDGVAVVSVVAGVAVVVVDSVFCVPDGCVGGGVAVSHCWLLSTSGQHSSFPSAPSLPAYGP